jgi:hypothetical protein
VAKLDDALALRVMAEDELDIQKAIQRQGRIYCLCHSRLAKFI